MKDLLATAPILHADETTGRAAGALAYVHVACTEYLTLMHVGGRSSKDIDNGGVLTEFIRKGLPRFHRAPLLQGRGCGIPCSLDTGRRWLSRWQSWLLAGHCAPLEGGRTRRCPYRDRRRSLLWRVEEHGAVHTATGGVELPLEIAKPRPGQPFDVCHIKCFSVHADAGTYEIQ